MVLNYSLERFYKTVLNKKIDQYVVKQQTPAIKKLDKNIDDILKTLRLCYMKKIIYSVS